MKENGIEEIEFKLQETNKSLSTFAAVIAALGQNSWALSDDLYFFYLKLGVLFMSASCGAGRTILTTLFEHYIVRTRGCTSTLRLEMGIAKKQLPPEFGWVIPERVNPARALSMIRSLFIETFAICERLMAKIYREPLEATKELFVEEFYSTVRGNKTEAERKLEETDEVRNLEDGLKLLAGFLKTKYCQLLQLRSDTLRGVLDNFLGRLTFFMRKTDLYADARMRKSYLMFYHLGYTMAAHISQSNRQTSKLWNLPKSVLLNIRKANFNFQLELAKDNLKDYLPINNYCRYSKWVNPDDAALPEEIAKNYNLEAYKPNPDRFFWVFSR